MPTKDSSWPPIRPVRSRNQYVVDAGTRLSKPDAETGKKTKLRRYFASKEDAKLFAEKCRIRLKNQGISGFKLTRQQNVDAEEAIKLLNGKSTLVSAVRFFLKYNENQNGKLSVSELVDEFINHKLSLTNSSNKGPSERTIQDYRHRLKIYSEAFGTQKLFEFDDVEFSNWLYERGDARGITRTTKALYSFAVERKYLPENPVKIKIPKLKIGKPSVLEDEDWKSLVNLALESQDKRNSKKGEKIDLLGFVVLGLWCGLRPESEIRRLEWSDVNIDEGFVNIHGDWKVSIGRHVTIPECAKKLLKLCKRKEGKIVKTKNLRRRWDWLRKSSGVYDKWNSDIMRHTYASMHYGLYGDKQKIINELGHCDSNMLRHYINHGVKIKRRAKNFFTFSPVSSNQQ